MKHLPIAALAVTLLAPVLAAGPVAGQEPGSCNLELSAMREKLTDANETIDRLRQRRREIRNERDDLQSRVWDLERIVGERLAEKDEDAEAEAQCRALYTSRAKSLNRYMLRTLSWEGRRRYVPKPEYLPGDEICELGGAAPGDVTVRVVR